MSQRKVEGLTAAATVWVTAALGIASGLGAWVIVIAGGAITLALLVLGSVIERLVAVRPRD